MMLSALSLFYAHPMWEHGDNIIATFGSYKKFIGLVILFDILAVERCMALKYAVHVPVSDHGRQVHRQIPGVSSTTFKNRASGLGSMDGRNLSLNTFGFCRFITGRPVHPTTYCCTCYPYVMNIMARVVVLLGLFIIFPASILTGIQFAFGFVCDHYAKQRGMFEAIVIFANTDYGLGITLETCEDPSWLDLSDPANPVYVGTNPHYLSGVLNIVGVIMLLLAQILINTRLVVYMSIYWYATDKRVANLVFLDDFVRVPDKEVVGSSSEVTLL